MISFPGGRIERGEEPDISARRELLEEMGMRCGFLKLLHSAQLDSTILWTTHFFAAYDCEVVQEPQLEFFSFHCEIMQFFTQEEA